MKKRTLVRRVLAAAAVLYFVWLAMLIVPFKRYGDTGGASTGSPPGSPREWELEGVYHVHSRFSDGRRSADSIAAAGAAAGLDFVILTDHGNPNTASLAAQGKKSGLLLLAGSEISTSRGHLAALGFEPPLRPFSQIAEMAAREVAALGGFTVIAHPYSKTRWSWGDGMDFAGIEVFNGDTTVKRRIVRAILSLPALWIKPEAVLLPLVDRPAVEMGKWYRLAEGRPVDAYFAADAHLAYRPLFRLFHVHVLLDAPPAPDFENARRQVFAALKSGRFYNAIEAAAAARGFRFWAERAGVLVPMGGAVRPDPDNSRPLKFTVWTPFAFAHETRLLKDGQEVGRSNGPTLVHESAGPGVFRVEVYLREKTPLDGRVPWIVSNPIFLERPPR
jgi:hypothetical protein